jgi:hypothetical protein
MPIPATECSALVVTVGVDLAAQAKHTAVAVIE